MKHHQEWLSLVPNSGPFFTPPVLERVFPQGLDALDKDIAAELRLIHEEWAESTEGGSENHQELHQNWIQAVLEEGLDFDDEVIRKDAAIPSDLQFESPQHHEVVRPDIVLVNPEGSDNEEKPRLLIQIWPAGQELDGTVSGATWSASPAERMTELCHATEVRLGLVTNGEHWMLVNAPVGETSGYGSWYANIWFQEPLTLRAFRSLLGAARFFGVADQDTPEAMLAESVAYQQEVTDRLGIQVREAVELLIQSLDRADMDRDRTLLKDVPPDRLYNAALTVMMRLVFLFSAEERDLLLLGDMVYDGYYAVSTLRGQLREDADRLGIEVLEHRQDAWARLLATFRAVYGGISHEALRLPALGGSLFDPDQYPFLEGRQEGSSWRITPANPLPIDNRTVLHLLESLQVLNGRKLSFRALNIEQIGYVYEGLLDHVAISVETPMIGLKGAQGREPEVALQELESLSRKGEESLIEFLNNETKRSKSALRNGLNQLVDDQARERLRIACGNDKGLAKMVLPYFGLLREDVWGNPVVYREGSFMVTGGPDRRETGTHYTPVALTKLIVNETLKPVVYHGPAKGKPAKEWKLRPPAELLSLKICDMAMGSAAFLVQVCVWLAERLLESWEAEEKGGNVILADGTVAEKASGKETLPKSRDERLMIARRLIAEQCLYGVDINPMAVELAKLSIWLVTMAKGRPFGFLDHNLRCGDSLLGVQSVDQIKHFHMNPDRGKEIHHSFFDPSESIDAALQIALEKRRELRKIRILDIEDIKRMVTLHKEAQEAISRIDLIGDLLMGCTIASAAQSESAYESSLIGHAQRVQQWLSGTDSLEGRLRKDASKLLGTDLPERIKERRPFHWQVEFPEVFENGGFDAIIGNPPFMGGQKITGNLGTAYREYLIWHLAHGKRGSADLCAYFYLRAASLLKNKGMAGLLATNTIAQGDTREVGLEQLVEDGFTIPRAVPSRKWPGAANLEVAIVWMRKGDWGGEHHLNEIVVSGISPYLAIPGEVTGNPYRLAANKDKSFQGSIVLGMGFIMTPEEAQRLIDKNPQNKDVLFPYLNGEDLNSRPDQSPSRWVINFFDWPLNRSTKGSWTKADAKKRKAWLREGIVPSDYPDPVAADYPDCLKIIEEKVKPERTRKKENGEYALRSPLFKKWWIYAEKRPKLYSTIAGMERVLVKGRISPTNAMAFVNKRVVFHDQCIVFPIESWAAMMVLHSSIHWEWVRLYTSTLGGRTLIYSPSDCFDTFPFPPTNEYMDRMGRELHNLRQEIMETSRFGLTTLYNSLSDSDTNNPDIEKLRDLMVEIDKQCAESYGLAGVDLGHGFYETKQGMRFTISPTACRAVLARLLQENHLCYQNEVEQGLHS